MYIVHAHVLAGLEASGLQPSEIRPGSTRATAPMKLSPQLRLQMCSTLMATRARLLAVQLRGIKNPSPDLIERLHARQPMALIQQIQQYRCAA